MQLLHDVLNIASKCSGSTFGSQIFLFKWLTVSTIMFENNYENDLNEIECSFCAFLSQKLLREERMASFVVLASRRRWTEAPRQHSELYKDVVSGCVKLDY